MSTTVEESFSLLASQSALLLVGRVFLAEDISLAEGVPAPHTSAMFVQTERGWTDTRQCPMTVDHTAQRANEILAAV
jgi:hypothetical protein